MKYPFDVYKMKVGEHEFWAAESKTLDGCVAQGESSQEAIAELEISEEAWLEAAEKYGIPIPPVPVKRPRGNKRTTFQMQAQTA